MLASVRSAVLEGVDGRVVTVEVHVSRGLPGYTVVGLPDAAGQESRERVRAALLSSGLDYPLKRVTVNLAPAAGAQDRARVSSSRSRWRSRAPTTRCPQACSTVSACSASSASTARSGRSPARCRSSTRLRVPASSAWSCRSRTRPKRALVPGVHVRVARTLGELHACLKGEAPWPDPPEPAAPLERARRRRAARPRRRTRPHPRAPRARGGRRGRASLPAWSARPASARRCWPAGCRRSSPTSTAPRRSRSPGSIRRPARARPRRCGHDRPSARRTTARPRSRWSAAAAVASGPARSRSRTAEFSSSTRCPSSRPMCSKRCASRSKSGWSASAARRGRSSFPSDFLLVGCANPCPCGRIERDCRCSDAHRTRYARRLSAPLLDRFDLRLRIEVSGDEAGPSSATVRDHVELALAASTTPARGDDLAAQRPHPGGRARGGRAAGR